MSQHIPEKDIEEVTYHGSNMWVIKINKYIIGIFLDNLTSLDSYTVYTAYTVYTVYTENHHSSLIITPFLTISIQSMSNNILRCYDPVHLSIIN